MQDIYLKVQHNESTPVPAGPDGSLLPCRAVHCDPVTGLIRPNAHSHMLLASGHTMAVPPDFFLHPHTGRVLPIAGSVAYDPATSALVLTTDPRAGDMRGVDQSVWPVFTSTLQAALSSYISNIYIPISIRQSRVVHVSDLFSLLFR